MAVLETSLVAVLEASLVATVPEARLAKPSRRRGWRCRNQARRRGRRHRGRPVPTPRAARQLETQKEMADCLTTGPESGNQS